MGRKYHKHTLQTNPRHREEETQNTNSHMTSKSNKSKATSFVFPCEMIVKLETKISTAQQNKDHTQNLHKMGETINNEPTTQKPPPENRHLFPLKPEINHIISLFLLSTWNDLICCVYTG